MSSERREQMKYLWSMILPLVSPYNSRRAACGQKDSAWKGTVFTVMWKHLKCSGGIGSLVALYAYHSVHYTQWVHYTPCKELWLALK